MQRWSQLKSQLGFWNTLMSHISSSFFHADQNPTDNGQTASIEATPGENAGPGPDYASTDGGEESGDNLDFFERPVRLDELTFQRKKETLDRIQENGFLSLVGGDLFEPYIGCLFEDQVMKAMPLPDDISPASAIAMKRFKTLTRFPWNIVFATIPDGVNGYGMLCVFQDKSSCVFLVSHSFLKETNADLWLQHMGVAYSQATEAVIIKFMLATAKGAPMTAEVHRSIHQCWRLAEYRSHCFGLLLTGSTSAALQCSWEKNTGIEQAFSEQQLRNILNYHMTSNAYGEAKVLNLDNRFLIPLPALPQVLDLFRKTQLYNELRGREGDLSWGQFEDMVLQLDAAAHPEFEEEEDWGLDYQAGSLTLCLIIGILQGSPNFNPDDLPFFASVLGCNDELYEAMVASLELDPRSEESVIGCIDRLAKSLHINLLKLYAPTLIESIFKAILHASDQGYEMGEMEQRFMSATSKSLQIEEELLRLFTAHLTTCINSRDDSTEADCGDDAEDYADDEPDADGASPDQPTA